MMKITINLILLLSLFVVCTIHTSKGFSKDTAYNPRNYGAKGNGSTVDTYAIQDAINDCHQNGGGRVVFSYGTFISGTIILKSNVTLYIETGAILKASNNLEDFPIMSSKYPSYEGRNETNKMLIYAEGTKNISIIGRGIIDGNGDYWIDGPYGTPSFSKRPRIIHFRSCENIVVRDVTLYNSASWVQSYQSCKNIVIDGITVESRENKDIEKVRYADVPGRNTDGLDLVDCQQVRISNCYINSGDDAICLKSFSPNEGCRDIVINNCVVSSNASGIKIGTETAGAFEDIIVQNCTVFDTRVDALSIMSVDGARIERIIFSNITMRNIKGTALFIRLGNRNRSYRENASATKGKLKNIIIENIVGSGIGGYGCSITGLPGMELDNITLSDINLEFTGGNRVLNLDNAKEISSRKLSHDEIKIEINREVPENANRYPRGEMFGRLPAYGFYVRHVRNLCFNRMQLGFFEEDIRPAIICDDVYNLEIKGLKAEGTANTPELIRFVNVSKAVVSESSPVSQVPVFLSLRGDNSNHIVLQNNLLIMASEKITYEKESMNSILTEIGNIK